MAIVMVGCTLAICGTIRNDFILLHAGPLLEYSLAIRVAQIGVTVVLLALLWRAKRPYQLDWIGAAWAIATAIYLGLVGIVTRLPVGEVQGPIIGLGVATTIFYFAQRGRVCGRAVASAIAAVALLILIFHPASAVSRPAMTTGPITVLLLNIIGFASARSFDEQRFKRYDAEQQERRARRELAAKNRELAIQKENAEAMYRARTAFLAAMSHEFRTPMNAVIGLSDVLVNAPLEAEYREHARTIRDSASALLVLLNDVLDFAKIDAGKLEIAPAPFDIRALLGSVVDMMQPTAAAKNIALRTRFSNDLPEYLLGDDARLRQVLVNLLSNAVKFTAKGTVTFTVDCQAVNESVREIGFSVEDTGVGMSPEVIGRLFRPFEQGDGGVGRRYGGTGLGLVISQQIVTAMGGNIHVESHAGRGSTFAFKVQLPEAEAPAPYTARGVRSLFNPGRPLAILVVDDLPLNRTVARAILARLGYEADVAEDGAKAIESVTKRNYDVVFMDLQMPGMSGIETTQRITEKLAGQRMPKIIAMSASVFEEDRAACRAVGMQDFIAKPIDIEKLDNVLARIAGHRGRTSSGVHELSSIDHAPLAKLRELESLDAPGFVASLCREFLTDAPERIQRMKGALNRKDWQELERDAHSLKSSSASLGAILMSKLCATIETAARKNEGAELETLLDQLEQELPRVAAAFKREGLA